MRYAIRNLTEVDYAAPVSFACFNLRLRPAQWPGQRLLSFRLAIEPEPASIREEAGPHVVNTSRLALAGAITTLRIEARIEIEVAPPVIVTADSPTIAEIRARAIADTSLDATSPCRYLFASNIARPAPEIAVWARGWFPEDRPVIAAGRALMAAIHRQFRYEAGATDTRTPPVEAFRARHGVCQDFAHVMIVAARAQGIPAAYVSGYLRTVPPKGQPRLVGADAMHAWVHLWCGDSLGWVGFDPTNDCLAGDSHILTAMGRDYADVAPLDGVFRGGGRQKLHAEVDVVPQEADVAS